MKLRTFIIMFIMLGCINLFAGDHTHGLTIQVPTPDSVHLKSALTELCPDSADLHADDSGDSPISIKSTDKAPTPKAETLAAGGAGFSPAMAPARRTKPSKHIRFSLSTLEPSTESFTPTPYVYGAASLSVATTPEHRLSYILHTLTPDLHDQYRRMIERDGALSGISSNQKCLIAEALKDMGDVTAQAFLTILNYGGKCHHFTVVNKIIMAQSLAVINKSERNALNILTARLSIADAASATYERDIMTPFERDVDTDIENQKRILNGFIAKMESTVKDRFNRMIAVGGAMSGFETESLAHITSAFCYMDISVVLKVLDAYDYSGVALSFTEINKTKLTWLLSTMSEKVALRTLNYVFKKDFLGEDRKIEIARLLSLVEISYKEESTLEWLDNNETSSPIGILSLLQGMLGAEKHRNHLNKEAKKNRRIENNVKKINEFLKMYPGKRGLHEIPDGIDAFAAHILAEKEKFYTAFKSVISSERNSALLRSTAEEFYALYAASGCEISPARWFRSSFSSYLENSKRKFIPSDSDPISLDFFTLMLEFNEAFLKENGHRSAEIGIDALNKAWSKIVDPGIPSILHAIEEADPDAKPVTK